MFNLNNLKLKHRIGLVTVKYFIKICQYGMPTLINKWVALLEL